MDIQEELFRIVVALTAAEIDYAVCGGLAVALHGHVRATEDIDLVVRHEDMIRILAALRPTGFVVPAEPMTFDAGTPAQREVHRVSKIVGSSHMTLDLITGPAFTPVLESRVHVPWRGGKLSIVSRDGLRLMKTLAGRPQDLLDLDSLGIPRD